jgi:hypothetical protein
MSQPKENRMNLSKMIDLIAEAAAKQRSQEENSKEEAPDAVLPTILESFGVPRALFTFSEIFILEAQPSN